MSRNPIAGPPMSLPPDHPPGDSILVTVGDIGCSSTLVYTPSGVHPLAGTTWILTHQTTVRERIPTYAIVLAVLFVLACFLGLLFLAIREQRIEGFVQVSVQGPDFYYATQVPVGSPEQVFDTERRVNYIRALVAGSSRWG
ncbi:hypothetical protein [Nocardia sp. NPDC051570]|uniref:hypothetical protein n=1 Tax=Nocardia sp. NPDC051570 TaxID=3364324 RepID=UPI0037AFA25A